MSGRKPSNQAFVLRLWCEDDADECGIWRGWIQHVGSGEKVFVQTLADFLNFIERHFGDLSGGYSENISGNLSGSIIQQEEDYVK